MMRVAHQQQEARAGLAAGETQRSIARSDNVSQATISIASQPILNVRSRTPRKLSLRSL